MLHTLLYPSLFPPPPIPLFLALLFSFLPCYSLSCSVVLFLALFSSLSCSHTTRNNAVMRWSNTAGSLGEAALFISRYECNSPVAPSDFDRRISGCRLTQTALSEDLYCISLSYRLSSDLPSSPTHLRLFHFLNCHATTTNAHARWYIPSQVIRLTGFT